MFSDFHDRNADKVYSIPRVETKELTKLGKGLCIGYESDKWDEGDQNYLHDFETDPELFSTSDGKTLILTGGNLNVTKRGIIG